MSYWVPTGGLPGQTDLTTGESGRAVFTEAYAVLPRGTMRDIVTSRLPHWDDTRLWVIARPLSGFAETFSWYVVEVAPGGGSERPDDDPEAEAVLLVVGGTASLTLGSVEHRVGPGGYAFVPPGTAWSLRNDADEPATFHWIRKAYERVDGVDVPEAFVVHEDDVAIEPMPGTDGAWGTQRFVDPLDVRHDMHVNIVTFEPGGAIPFPETHVMEHGLYVLEGKAVYLLNKDWVEVQAGDFMWLRAFCPQACYAGGPGRFRYLLYKDVNRHPRLRLNSSAL
ncbi:(S)-ureidoglycine aminohydrolase [Nocardioides sp. Root122]|uniref:bifunctional allantoicase/(S)-ureidoglycine aminohydrolase n=1 Tax=Nocardioides TaxID=1839 RepID=UPI000702C553|nr:MULTISPECIES: bifunctional allantoicase/(S)-ureidoglycine aminohydrolase [Nocardioides]KQV65059.1 (S)-ureidoglycine aminohydrolase [Nocardioides sp. Root122]MCK9823359.1 bifunctional allantoicase/(S)-ureidoglycine aminohydrolase [Nocardioides cavernae]